jgi:coenzyme F420-dependent glucose-6-phosphate dehydrogenase
MLPNPTCPEDCPVPQIGYALSSEEHRPNDLVAAARQAEEAGFSFALVSDHFHPWLDTQGQSPFVWSVLGALANATERMTFGTGVTCPLQRTHPAIIAQAAATVADMMPGRFFLGVGTGERLNEHILGDPWPAVETRLAMLEEAVDLIRELWRGELTTRRGRYYTVDTARIYTLPERLPPIHVAAGGALAARTAARIGDGLISTSPEREIVETYQTSGGDGPRFGQLTVCWARDEQEARRTALQNWSTAALRGQVSQELALPSHFEALASTVTDDQIAESVICGPDPEAHRTAVGRYLDAGFDHVYVHQVGPDQTGFIDFYAREILPGFSGVPTGASTSR